MFEILELWGDPILFALMGTAFALCVSLVRKIGRGHLSIVFISFAAGLVFLFLSRLFLVMADKGFHQLSDTSMHIWWHLIFYLSMAAFAWGGYRVKSVIESDAAVGLGQSDRLFLGALVALTTGIFLVAQPLESVIDTLLPTSFIDGFGLHHFLAMAAGLLVSYYMNYIRKNWGASLVTGMPPMIVFLAMMGLQHLWELLTESWVIIRVSEEIIEGVELIVLVIGIASLVFALLRIRKVLNNPFPNAHG